MDFLDAPFEDDERRASAMVAPLVIKKEHSRSESGSTTSHHARKSSEHSRRTPSVKSQGQISPPLTPRTSQDALPSMTTLQIVFHNYLRAFYPFHPTSTVSSSSDESSITVPIDQGDVILVHSIHPNGWADGTVIASGERGWLPTNYCEPYDPSAMRTLLNGLTHLWDLVRMGESGDLAPFTKQDYVRAMIAGVRFLLESSQCLTRESPLIQAHIALRRIRKGLLGDLSSLVKAAKKLQSMLTDLYDDNIVIELLDEIVTKALKLVYRAVRFLDIWCQETGTEAIYFQEDSSRPLTPPKEVSYPKRTSSHPSYNTENRVSLALTDATSVISQQSSMLGVDTSEEARSSEPLRSPTGLSGLGKGSALVHRLSYTSKAAATRNANLASEQLGAAHDSLIGYIGSFIGLHLQSRSSADFLHTTQQSVIACRKLLAVLEAVWERDGRRSESLQEARDCMYARLRELVQATKELLTPTDAGQEEEVFLPDQGKKLVTAATSCVRAAGDCVARTRTVIEKTGDFEVELTDSALPGSLNAEPAKEPVQEEAQETDQEEEDGEEEVVVEEGEAAHGKEAEEKEEEEKESDAKEETSALDDAAETAAAGVASKSDDTPPPPPPKSDSEPEATIRAVDSKPLPELPNPKPEVPEKEPSDAAPLVRNSSSVTARNSRTSVPPLAQLPIPQLPQPEPSPTDSNSPVSASQRFFGKALRTESVNVSVADSNSTYPNSVRGDSASIISQTSTRATTPENASGASRAAESVLSASYETTSTDPFSKLGDEDAAVVEQLLTKTYVHELIYNKDGQISGGSLPALVEQLTTHESTPDAMFVTTFYLTFRLFTTPLDFARCLIDRFDYIGDSSNVGIPVRLRVFNVFKGWLESHWQPEPDASALGVILTFATGKLRSALPAAGKRLAELISKVSDYRTGSLVPRLVSSFGKTSTSSTVFSATEPSAPNPIVSKGQLNTLKSALNGGNCSILDFDPLELARQLTLIESRLFCAIQPEELLLSEREKRDETKGLNVKAMSTLSTDLANWVADSILSLEEPKKRALVIKQWVKVSSKCLELNNYDSLMAIICSLNSAMVFRLKRTWEIVSQKTKTRLEELQTIISVDRNYAVLRLRLQNHIAPCLPFVGIYLTDLTFNDVGNQTTRQLPGDCNGQSVSVINFDKHMRTAKIIGQLQRFQVPYRLTPIGEMQDWINSELQRVQKSEQANVQSYYRRSLLLEPRAEKIPKFNLETSSSAMSTTSRETKDRFDFLSTFHFSSSGNVRKDSAATSLSS